MKDQKFGFQLKKYAGLKLTEDARIKNLTLPLIYLESWNLSLKEMIEVNSQKNERKPYHVDKLQHIIGKNRQKSRISKSFLKEMTEANYQKNESKP